MKNHPLFPEAPEADITTIHVTRFENGRKNFAPQKFTAEELTGIDQIWDRYGGGLFELVGQGKNKSGHHGLLAKQEWPIDGAPKPLAPTGAVNGHVAQAPAAPVPAAPAGGDVMAVLLGLIGTLMNTMVQMVSAMSQASAARAAAPIQAAPDAQFSALNTMVAKQMDMVNGLITALTARKGDDKDPIQRVLDVIEMTSDLKRGAVDAAKAAAGASSGGELDLKTVAEGADKMVDVLKKVKDLADNGASPADAAKVAAEAAARSAEAG